MDAVVKQETRFLPALAEQLALWFPELGGRALAVSEVSITKDNVPTLPLAMTAFIRSTANPPPTSKSTIYEIVDTFIVDFWLEPARYKKTNGTETPFWSYYDYEAIRDTLLTHLSRWDAPGGERIAFRGMTIEAEPLAVTLTFTFMATYRWCAPKQDVFPEGFIKGVRFHLCTPLSECCDPECFDDKDKDPCDPCP
jgi:hypothetical protein